MRVAEELLQENRRIGNRIIQVVSMSALGRMEKVDQEIGTSASPNKHYCITLAVRSIDPGHVCYFLLTEIF